jgi:hypothetical protein
MKTIEQAPAVEIPASQAAIPTAPATPAAAVPAPKAKKAKEKKPDSVIALGIIQAAKAVAGYFETADVKLETFTYRAVEKVKGMHVVRVPSFKEAVKKLPESEDAKLALQMIQKMSADVAALTGGPSNATWVIRETGSVAIYTGFAR